MKRWWQFGAWAILFVVFLSLWITSDQPDQTQVDAQQSLPAAVTIEEIDDLAVQPALVEEGVEQNDFEDRAAVEDDSVSMMADDTELVIPKAFDLAIPFTPQAPHANWDLPYQEACEEASVLMAVDFLDGSRVDLSGADAADREILDMVAFQQDRYGFHLDTTAEETARFARDRYKHLAFDVLYDPSIDDIKQAVAAGSPVIVPAAGRELGNPFFSGEGPLYHMLVIRGYTQEAFVTNDPGTRRGESYAYSINTIMQAMGDWNDGDPANGAKVVIVASRGVR